MSVKATYQEQGVLIKDDNIAVFFGNKNISKAELSNTFTNYDFKFVKQVHGNKIVKSDDSIHEADGHWSNEARRALCVVTADCLPLFIYSKSQNFRSSCGLERNRKRNYTTIKEFI
jgi:copper oxidase (laccase) domain-containing protein